MQESDAPKDNPTQASADLVRKVHQLAGWLAQAAGEPYLWPNDVDSNAPGRVDELTRRSLLWARDAVLNILEADDPNDAAFGALRAVEYGLRPSLSPRHTRDGGRPSFVDFADELVTLTTPEALRERRAVVMSVRFFRPSIDEDLYSAVLEVRGQVYRCHTDAPDTVQALADLEQRHRSRPIPYLFTELKHFTPVQPPAAIKHIPVTFPLLVQRLTRDGGPIWVAKP